jgi:aromatic-L-amino-acid decarboxylase
MSRDFRGLRVWLPLRLHGSPRSATPSTKSSTWPSTRYRELARDDRLELPRRAAAQHRRLSPARGRRGALLDAVNGSGRAFLSSTLLGGKVALRMCILSFRTERPHVDDALGAIRQALG